MDLRIAEQWPDDCFLLALASGTRGTAMITSVKTGKRSDKRWTPEEDQRLLALFDAEASWPLIAITLELGVEDDRLGRGQTTLTARQAPSGVLYHRSGFQGHGHAETNLLDFKITFPAQGNQIALRRCTPRTIEDKDATEAKPPSAFKRKNCPATDERHKGIVH
jgi:hypothetical protein